MKTKKFKKLKSKNFDKIHEIKNFRKMAKIENKKI